MPNYWHVEIFFFSYRCFMKLINITDINIPQLQIYNSLRENIFTKGNSFIADSPKVVNELLHTDIQIQSILATQEYYDEFSDLIESKNIDKLYIADKNLLSTIVGHKIHHNCMMHGIRPAKNPLADLGDTVIMLDWITSSENIGSIARSTAALGIDSYLLPKTSPHPYTRRALRVSMGHISKIKYHIYEDIFETISQLKNLGYKIFAAEVTKTSTSLWNIQVPQKWVLLMGHEGFGLSAEILSICDEVVTIEMVEEVRSLNVAVAASILMYQFKNRS